jgi:peptidylprolyl isomerase
MRALLLMSAALVVAGAAPPKKLTPTDIVNDAPATAWKQIPSDDLLVMDLKNGERIVLQLAPQFAPIHVANIRALARGNYWDGATIYRVQDAYVVQWGQNDSEKGFPAGVVGKPPAEYTRSTKGLAITPLGSPDAYAPGAGFVDGWPVAFSLKAGWANLAHCYGSVGVGRDLSPDTGTGGELYAAINPLRHLDRNIAVVGRIIDGMGNLSALPRGTEALGFYKDKSMYVPIASVRLASEMPASERRVYEYMDTKSASFAKYLKLRANRHDDFYIRPAGGVDLCNVSPPVRKKA